MKAIVNQMRQSYSEDGKQELILTLSFSQDVSELITALNNGKLLDVEIKQHRKHRSLDANSFLWVICDKIAKKIKDGRTTKEDIYRQAIRQVGVFEIVPIADDEVEERINKWNSIGDGWFSEVLHDSKLSGYKNIRAYFGSSSYNTLEMSILIDYIVEDAKELGIDTMTPNELVSLKSKWGGG
jgi:hypothetical protein